MNNNLLTRWLNDPLLLTMGNGTLPVGMIDPNDGIIDGDVTLDCCINNGSLS